MPIKLMCSMQFSRECHNKQDYLRRSGQDYFSSLLKFLLQNEYIVCNHTYNQSQIEWYNEGSALNLIKKENANS